MQTSQYCHNAVYQTQDMIGSEMDMSDHLAEKGLRPYPGFRWGVGLIVSFST